MAEDGNWAEGVPRQMLKYVFPTAAQFWLTALVSMERVPTPSLQLVTGEVLEGLVMLHAAARADHSTGERFTAEAVAKIHQALAGIPHAELESR